MLYPQKREGKEEEWEEKRAVEGRERKRENKKGEGRGEEKNERNPLSPFICTHFTD